MVVITGAGEKSFIAGADIGEFAGRTPVRPAPCDAQPAHLRRHGDLPQAGHRHDQRLLPGRRLRARHVVRHARRLGEGALRPAGDQPRPDSRAAAARSACRASSASATPMRMILSGDMIPAPLKPRTIGLVDLVFPAEELRAKTLELAQKIAVQEPAHAQGRQGGGARQPAAADRGRDPLRARPLLPLLLDPGQGGGRRGVPREATGAVDRSLSATMTSAPHADLLRWREEFPILARTTYLINNSLGAMPRRVHDEVALFAQAWDERGVRAWHEGWWEMSVDHRRPARADRSASTPGACLDAPERLRGGAPVLLLLRLSRRSATASSTPSSTSRA